MNLLLQFSIRSRFHEFDVDSGRCRLSDELFQRLNVKIGGILRIRLFFDENQKISLNFPLNSSKSTNCVDNSVDSCDILCTAWPESFIDNVLGQNTITADPAVVFMKSTDFHFKRLDLQSFYRAEVTINLNYCRIHDYSSSTRVR